jgi:hypothetical protein
MEEISNSLKKSIENNINSINVDLSENIIDNLINNDSLREIPIVKSIVSLTKIGVTVRDYFFLKKVIKFLNKIENIDIIKKQKFLNKIDSTPQLSKRLYESICTILDRFDNEDKAEILGNLFKSLIKEKINLNMFLRLSNIVEKTFIGDLILFRDFHGKNEELFNKSRKYRKKYMEENLANNGLLRPRIEENTYNQKHYNSKPEIKIKEYKITEIGELLIENGFVYD